MKAFTGIPTDYTQRKNWLALPDRPDKAVDLVYLYPSACFDLLAGTVCAAGSRSMRRGAKRFLTQQASAFAPIANIYAPFWRQVNATRLPGMRFEEVDRAEWAEPRTDVYAALDHYFTHLNRGRPYFLAAHSQGSRLCYMLLSEYMREHEAYYQNMIAAYCLGDSLTKRYLEANPHVKAAQREDDLGVVISWNTEGPGNRGRTTLVAAPGAVAVNPLNWRTDGTPAPAEKNLGSFVPHLLRPGLRRLRVSADAAIDPERGTVTVTEPGLEKYVITALPGFGVFEPVFGPASYHMCDWSFYYLNIRENARVRADAWAARHGGGPRQARPAPDGSDPRI